MVITWPRLAPPVGSVAVTSRRRLWCGAQKQRMQLPLRSCTLNTTAFVLASAYAIVLTGVIAAAYGLFYLRAVTDTPDGVTYARPRRQGALEVTSRSGVVGLALLTIPLNAILGRINQQPLGNHGEQRIRIGSAHNPCQLGLQGLGIGKVANHRSHLFDHLLRGRKY